MSKTRNRYFLLVLAVIVGMLFFAYSKNYSSYNFRMIMSDEVRVELREDLFEVALGISNTKEDMEAEPYIKWWYNGEDEKYYFFLPKSWEKNQGIFWAFTQVDEIKLDEKIVYEGDVFLEKEGEHLLVAEGNEYSIVVMYSSDIPALFLETEDGVLDYIHESKDNVSGAEYTLLDNKGSINNYGSIAELACRGNVSFKFTNKKSYRVKLQDKSQFLGLGAGKDWILLANPFDWTLSRNMVVNALAKELGMDYVPDMTYVDLYANGEYLGNYVLVEKIEVGSERVNIRDLTEANELVNPEVELVKCEQVIEQPGKLFSRKWWKIPNEPEDYTGGYLMEVEMLDRYGAEASGFITTRMQGVVVHNPKYASEKQIGYIADMYQDFEDAVFSETGYNENTGKYFYDYIDMDSFVMKYMLEEFVKNQDASVTSCYVYKPEYDSVMHAGPIWDYDLAINLDDVAGNGIYLKDPEGFYVAAQENNSESDIWWGLYGQDYFKKYVSEVFEKEFEDTAEDFVAEFIDENAEFILDSGMMNSIRRNLEDKEDYDKADEKFLENNKGLKDFLQARLEWLDEAWEYED